MAGTLTGTPVQSSLQRRLSKEHIHRGKVGGAPRRRRIIKGSLCVQVMSFGSAGGGGIHVTELRGATATLCCVLHGS